MSEADAPPWWGLAGNNLKFNCWRCLGHGSITQVFGGESFYPKDRPELKDVLQYLPDYIVGCKMVKCSECEGTGKSDKPDPFAKERRNIHRRMADQL